MQFNKLIRFARYKMVFRLPSVRRCSDSITYSGGQASSGQGGYYGSGGSRATKLVVPHYHPEACARPVDVQELNRLMKLVDTLEVDLKVKRTAIDIEPAVEVKDVLNNVMRDEETCCLLSRLVFMGEPVWGLTMKERDFVRWGVTNFLMDTLKHNYVVIVTSVLRYSISISDLCSYCLGNAQYDP